MLIECPHCFTRVLPRADGECPACQQNTQSVRDIDRQFKTVTVGETSAMPDHCSTCMLPETRLVRVTRSRVIWGAAGDSGVAAVVATVIRLLLGGIHFLFHLMTSERDSGSQKVVVQMRHCRECSRRQPLEPTFVNYDAYTMKFIVHREFAHEFVAMNVPESNAAD